MEIHGGIQKGNILDFSISINPYFPSWKDEMMSSCEKNVSKYTYIEWIEDEFKKLYGDDTVVLAGATEAFQIIGFTLMNKANVVIPMPSYGELERVAKFKSRKIHPVSSLCDAFYLSKRLALSGEKTVLIFSNPNNPTGLCVPKETKEWIKEVENVGVTVVVDEAFKDFVKSYVDISTPKTVKIRTFTKSYGMPGIRVGYVKTEDENVLETFSTYRAPWAIGACGYTFIEYLIKDEGKHLKETMPLIWKERERFLKLGMKTDANFGILTVKNATKIQSRLDEFGVHVRNCESFGLKNKIRVSVRKKEENDVLFEALRKINFFGSPQDCVCHDTGPH